jgi:hypothetical protein
MTVPGAVLLPKRKFKHIKLHCKCNSRILNHSGILGEDYIQYSLYECIGCGLTVTVPDFWDTPFTPTLTITVQDNPSITILDVEQARALFRQLDEIDARITQAEATKASAMDEKGDLEKRIEDALAKGKLPKVRRGRPRVAIPSGVQRLMQILSSKGTASVADLTLAMGKTEGNTRNLLAKAGKLGLIEKRQGKGLYGTRPNPCQDPLRV